jgi:hypothetical protein
MSSFRRAAIHRFTVAEVSFLFLSCQDAEEFYAAYDRLLQYLEPPENWPKIEAELAGRGVSD